MFFYYIKNSLKIYKKLLGKGYLLTHIY